MITQLDTKHLNAKHKKLPFRGDLEQFVDDVALLKPKAKFAIDNDCVAQDYVVNPTTNQYDRVETIYRVKVFEGGEQIGALMVYEEYRQGKKVPTYGVESFRIAKCRGRSDTTTSMHKKVAIRNAKKLIVARDNSELVAQITNMVKERVNQLEGGASNNVAWATNQSEVATAYAIAAYHARLSGSGQVILPANDANLIRNNKHADDNVAKYLEAKSLAESMRNKRGYAIQAYLDGSYAVVTLATQDVTKYAHFDDIPQDISEKLAMFKVIPQNDCYSHLGVKVLEHAFYIVDGKTQTES